MHIATKYFLFHGLHRKQAGLKCVRIAKKIRSSLLCARPLNFKKLIYFNGLSKNNGISLSLVPSF